MLQAILYIGISQFLFAGLLTFSRRGPKLRDYILGSWLLLMCIFMALTLLKNEFPDSGWGRLQVFPFFFTIGPFLFLYTRALSGEKQHLSFADGLHILPFAIFSTVAVLQPHPVDEDILRGNIFHWNMLVYSISALVSFFFYLSGTFVAIAKHQKRIQDHFSYQSRKINLRWVWVVTAVFSAILIITMGFTLANFIAQRNLINPGIPLFLGFTLFGYGISFFGVRQPLIFTPIQSKDERFEDTLEEELTPENDTESSDEVQRYERSSLTRQQAEKYAQSLQEWMNTEKPFLTRDLTILDVSRALDIPQHHLTETMNEYLGKNFYTLVNEYRVEEVKARLLDPKYAHLTVLAIAHDAGFNSKSSFNMTFKKMVGVTPSDFRKENGN